MKLPVTCGKYKTLDKDSQAGFNPSRQYLEADHYGHTSTLITLRTIRYFQANFVL